MNLANQLPQNNHVLAIAERVRKKFSSSKGKCEFMAVELTKALKESDIRAEHVMGNFHLDEPGAFEYLSPEDEEANDEYIVNHDWVSVEGKILDISADQFRKYVHDKIPDIVFIGYTDPLHNHYEELGYVEST